MTAQTQCPNCGARAPEDAQACSTCGTSLLVDVFLARPLADPRKGFQAAKDLSAMGPPAPAFAQARDRLASGTQALVAQVSRSFAAEVMAVLKTSGLEAVVRPAAVVPAPRIASRTWAGFGAMLLLAATYGMLQLRAPAVVAPVEAAPPVVVGKPLEPPVTARLTTQQISKKVLAAVAAVKCGEKVGSGFFVGPEKLFTNAHVVCTDGPVMVTLADGRNLLGKVGVKDPWTDLAVVEVAGANLEPLEVGDTTSLEPGDKIVFVGSPRGLDFTVHEGRVSFVGRNFLGLAYVQLDATVNPGNSGGPMFNDRGEVLGIVSMKVTDAEGIGLALPLEYAQAPANDAALARWQKILSRVQAEDLKEQIAERERMMPGMTQLVGSRTVEGRAVAVIMERWKAVPHAGLREFVFTAANGQTCAVRGSFSNWVSLKDAEAGNSSSRRIAWLLHNRIADGMFLSAGLVQSLDCKPAQLAGEGELTLREGGEGFGQFSVEGRVLSPVATAVAAAPAVVEHEVPDRREAEEEAAWRQRFRQIRQRIEQIQSSARAAKSEIDRMDQLVSSGRLQLSQQGNAQYQQLHDRLARTEPDRLAAEAELHELERQAALHAVPLEWRR